MTTTKGQHLIGQTIGSCVLKRILGRGGTSTVYLALNNKGEQVAVKVFMPRSTLDGSMRKSFYERFLQEVEAVSQFNHPNILSIYAYGEHKGMPYIVMPYMAGGTLSEHVQQHGPLPLQEAQLYLEQIAGALDYAHENNCVHCDVKPANILLDTAGNITLSDFGTARLLQAEGKASTPKSAKKNSAETLMGTPDYVSPEQALGETLDGRSDIYSLGATLYALLTGNPPFQADTPIALTLMHVNEAPTPVGLFRADVTSQIDFVMSKALAKWPDERYQTAGSFAGAFKQAISESEGKPRSSSGSFGENKARSGEVVTLASTSSGELNVVQRVVPIKLRPARSFRPWRTSLLVGLVVVLVLACLVTALFIRNINASIAHTQGTNSHLVSAGTPDAFDALSDQANWPQSSTFLLQKGIYSIDNILPPSVPAIVFYQDHNYGNFRIQVTALEVSAVLNGGDYYGLAFRAPLDQSRYYLFEITTWGHGQFVFLRYDGGTNWNALASGSLADFNLKAGSPNTLSVEARDDTFTLSLNGKITGKPVRDHSKKGLTVGKIGLIVEEHGAKVRFSHLYITELVS